MNFSENKTRVTIFGAVTIIGIALIISVLILSNTNFYIRNLGTSLEQNGQLINTISVTGDGKVFAKPDMAELNFSISELAVNSSTALSEANKKMDQIFQVLRSKGIPDTDYKTSQLSISPEYDYTSGGSVLKGQRAGISLNVKVKKIDEKAAKVTDIIDEVAKIDKVQIGSIAFDIEDKTALFSQARELAFNKASQKATELARYSSVKLLSPVSITDTAYDISSPSPTLNYSRASTSDTAAGSSQIATGQLEVSINLNVIFGIE